MKAGTKKVGGKSHEASVAIAEGLPLGGVHPSHIKMKVVDARHNSKPQKKAHAFNERSQAGGADTMGGCE
jgi:hypothetical protein